MFTLSLPVQRFVIGCIIMMILIILGSALMDQLWYFTDAAQNMIFESRTV